MKNHNVCVKAKAMIAAMMALMLVSGLALVSCEFSGSAGYGNNSGGGNTGDGTGGTYTVNFHVGEGGGVAPFPIRNVTAGDYIELPGQGNMTHPSKTFSGWRSGGAFYSPNTRLQVFANLEFTAQWTDAALGTPGGTNPGGTSPGGTGDVNSSIVGTWRSDNGDSTFIFNSNLTFSLSMAGNEGSGAYSVSGSVITIIMNGETYTGSLNGNTLIFFGRSYTKTNQGTNPPAATNPFEGTWNGIDPSDSAHLRLIFGGNLVTFTYLSGDMAGVTFVGSYTYSGNTATIFSEVEGGDVFYANVSGNTLTMVNMRETPVVFTRQ